MPISGCVIKSGATALTVTGGSDLTMSSDGLTVHNGVHVVDAAETDFRVQRHLTVKQRLPQLQPDGTFTKCVRTMVYTRPRLLADGTVEYDKLEVQRTTGVAATAAEVFELNMIGGQLLSDADFAPFWSGGNLA